MTDHKPSEPSPSGFKESAQRSEDAGIADESAAYENASDTPTAPSLDEGNPESTDDGSGTSETD